MRALTLLGMGVLGGAAMAQTGKQPVLVLEGRGVQVYACEIPADGGASAWALKRPEADLLDTAGKVVGQHGAGPVWRYKDGSAIHGVLLSKKASPEAGSVPWLVLQGVNPEGQGVMRGVVEIRREETHGGAAPATGCEVGTVGREQRVPYTAMYRFYGTTGQGSR